MLHYEFIMKLPDFIPANRGRLLHKYLMEVSNLHRDEAMPRLYTSIDQTRHHRKFCTHTRNSFNGHIPSCVETLHATSLYKPNTN